MGRWPGTICKPFGSPCGGSEQGFLLFCLVLGCSAFIDGGLVGADLDWTHYPADT